MERKISFNLQKRKIVLPIYMNLENKTETCKRELLKKSSVLLTGT